MLLTIQDAFPGSPSIALHAPRYLRTVWRGTMTFMQHRSSLYRALNEYSSPSTTFNDGRLSMTAFVIKADNVQRDVPEFLKEDPNYAYMQKEPAPQQDIGAKFDHQPLHSQDMIKKVFFKYTLMQQEAYCLHTLERFWYLFISSSSSSSSYFYSFSFSCSSFLMIFLTGNIH